MSYYIPDSWVVLKLPMGYKVLAGWLGHYDVENWRSIESYVTRYGK